MAGAKVVGYALPPEKDAVLFDCSGAAARMVSVEGDIRDRAHLQEVFHTYQPQVVFHLAAQPIVRIGHFSFYGYFLESVHKNIVVHREGTVKCNSSTELLWKLFEIPVYLC